MASPTREGGDDGARERATSEQEYRTEQAEAEALHEAPVPPAPEPREPEPQEPDAPEQELTDAERREAALEARASRVERGRGGIRSLTEEDQSSVERPRDEQGRFVSTTDEQDEQDDTGVQAEADESAEVAPEDPPKPSLPDGIRQGEDGKWYVDLVVDGEARSVPYSQYHANAQKYLTGDQRLQQAALERKRLEALQAPQSPQPPSGAGVNEPPQGAQQGMTREQLEKAVIEGDEQAQNALLERLNREQPQYDPAVIATTAATQAREQIEVETAIAQVSADPVNAMILGDSVMRDVANRYSETLRETEPHLRPAENIARALEMTREHVARYAPAPAPAPTTMQASLQQRTAAKAAHASHNAPPGGQARQPLAPPAPPQGRSTRSVVEQMRLDRGLA